MSYEQYIIIFLEKYSVMYLLAFYKYFGWLRYSTITELQLKREAILICLFSITQESFVINVACALLISYMQHN